MRLGQLQKCVVVRFQGVLYDLIRKSIEKLKNDERASYSVGRILWCKSVRFGMD